MPQRRAAILVLVILLSGLAVGGVAGYRMHLMADFHENAEPVMVHVTIDYPDGTTLAENVTVQGADANALGALEAAANGTITVGIRATSLGVYVHTIGPYRAEGQCGWMYSIGGRGEAYQPERAADRESIEDGAWVAWYWGCL